MRVLTTAGDIGCGHPSGRVATEGVETLSVGGAAVVTRAGVVGRSVGDCALKDDPNTGTVQCRTVATVGSGDATALTVDGAAVLLAEAVAGTTDGVVGGNPGTLSASDGQEVLTAT